MARDGTPAKEPARRKYTPPSVKAVKMFVALMGGTATECPPGTFPPDCI